MIQYGQLNGFQRNQINFILVRGDGEIVEEIVSKEQQKEINKVMDISHFSYSCKMRYPLNLVLENCEYLWIY